MATSVLFVPIAGAHSIEEVVFSLSLANAVSRATVENILKDPFFAEKYIYQFRHLGVTTGVGSYPQGLAPVVTTQSTPHVMGLQMCDKPLPEQPGRLIYAVGAQVTHARRIYSTWQETAPDALADLNTVLRHTSDQKVASITLAYKDKFVSTNAADGFSLRDMFNHEARLLTQKFVDDTGPWHSNVGYWHCGVLVNVTVQHAISDENSVVSVEAHCSKMDMPAFKAEEAALKIAFDELHTVHRIIMHRLLSNSLCDRIGMSATRGGLQ